MKLTHLTLENYRCFETVQISLHPQLTVIVAENGLGKSTLLDAIRVGLWPFISSFDLAKSSTYNDPLNSISINDSRLIKSPASGMTRVLPTRVTLRGDWGLGRQKQWTRYRESEADKSKTKDDPCSIMMKDWAREVQNSIRDINKPTIDLPVFGYYGTGRLWAQKRLLDNKTKEKEDSTSKFHIRTFAYRNCMDPASSYKYFREWFIWCWESYTNMMTRKNTTDAEKNIASARIEVIQKAIDTFLTEPTGWHTLEYSVEDQCQLILSHPDYGRMSVDYLSDGIRSVLSMVGDIAHRCIKLNPQKREMAAAETCGVVLIDEIDMHLHPRWQQLVLTQLVKAFPKIQFIVTTHSPQVLTTVKPECIRGMKLENGELVVKDTYQFSEGAEAQVVLEDILGVETRPANLEIVKFLKEYLSLISSDQWDSARAIELRRNLDAWSNGYEPELLRADIHIKMRNFRRQSK